MKTRLAKPSCLFTTAMNEMANRKRRAVRRKRTTRGVGAAGQSTSAKSNRRGKTHSHNVGAQARRAGRAFLPHAGLRQRLAVRRPPRRQTPERHLACTRT